MNENGLLPAGVHDCTLAELRERFGSFRSSDQRPKLFAKLGAFVTEASALSLVRSILVDGSFVTAKTEPGDIDLIIVLAATHDFSADLNPAAYNVLSKRRVHRLYGFDILVAREGSEELGKWIEFFEQVRLEPGQRKGILRLVP